MQASAAAIVALTEPSNVRHQTGSYGEALAKHEERFQNNSEKDKNNNMERLHKWKMALKHAANLSGYHFNPRNNGYEYEFIQQIVRFISNQINRVPLHVVDYPVGLQRQVLKVYSLLDVRSNDEVKVVGIYGPGGMGKTTLAKAVYNFIADQFECVCFLHNVRENSTKHGLEHLQNDLLSQTVGFEFKLRNSSEGISTIKQRLQRKKVLLILDDVDELKQLQALVGGLDWFSVGSRVIITTRDKHLLASHGIDVTYEIRELNKKEALELLRWKTFKGKQVNSSYEHVLKRAVNYASGLPLALEILGSNLFGKHIEEWNSLLDRYERIPNKGIQKILKVSFDALEEDEQSVFLDIACCFKGYKLKEVEDILCAHYSQCMKYHIGVLVEKSLVKISRRGYVRLHHDLIEDVGKEIVRTESPKDPEKRSRLWFREDIFQAFEKNSGSQVEMIHLEFPLPEKIEEWKGDEFKKMESLKTLTIKNSSFVSKPQVQLPNGLRALEWPRYPSQHIPSDFRPKNLSICKLPNSDLTSFTLANSLKERMFLCMKVLHLDDSKCLTEISDVSGLQNLEEFSFQRCENLLTIHDSVGFLYKLKILNAEGCSKLRRFPPIQLPSLQKLELSFCKSLKNFPEILGKMESIQTICFRETLIEELPDSFQHLTKLIQLVLLVAEAHQLLIRIPSSILMMPKLNKLRLCGYHLLPNQSDKPSSMVSSKVKYLRLDECKLKDDSLPIILKLFANLTHLDLSLSNFTILPECIKEHQSLISLNLDDCTRLQEIRGIPPNLKFLSALNCELLSSSCTSMLLNQELHEVGGTIFCLPGKRIPEWFELQSRGWSFSFWIRNRLPSISLLYTTESMINKSCLGRFCLPVAQLYINGRECTFDDPLKGDYIWIKSDHTYLLNLNLQDMVGLDETFLKNEWNHAHVLINPLRFRKSQMHIFKQESSMDDIQFSDPYKKRELDDDVDDVFYDVDDVLDGDDDDDKTTHCNG
ncbi:unnamed protein product [Trifolium pratense]|uniref:Uncharacterized protein n=1 Tax=Trifolium pratense TaxID=57577 RepID=A0ACB0LCH7_TRIPR|nr:unnamed protein product [Trifolium pratense]